MRSLEFGDHDLTPREREVAALVAQGLTAKEIADSLFVSVPTVKSHLREIFRKCGLRNRAELAAWWVAHAEEREAGEKAEPQVAMAESASFSSVSVRTRRKWRRPLFALALAVAAGVAAIFLSPLGADPFALGAGDSPPPPPALNAVMGGEHVRGSWETTDGRFVYVEYAADCRLADTRLPGDGWEWSTLSPEEELTEAIATRGWVQQGIYDCSYGPVAVTASDGQAFSLPGETVACYQVTRSVLEAYGGEEDVAKYGWYDGILWCDEQAFFSYLRDALAEHGLDLDMGDSL